MTLTLSQFLAELDRYQRRVPLDELVDRLERLEITPEDYASFCQFGESTYRRNLMHAGPGYQALILCWRSGHRSPIHDHRGSSCGVRVLQGIASETIFDRDSEGRIFPTVTHALAEGGVCGSQDADIHQVSNLQPPGRDLVTLHVYSPPLLRMNTYSLTDQRIEEFVDPIFEFADGAGI